MVDENALHSADFDRTEPAQSSDIHSKPVRENLQSLELANDLRGRALDPPDAQIYIEPGRFKFTGSVIYSWNGGIYPASGVYPFPTSSGNSRIDLVGFFRDGQGFKLDIVQGNAGPNPSPPSIPDDIVPSCFVHTNAGAQVITKDMIAEARSFMQAGVVHDDSVGQDKIKDDSVGISELDPDRISWLKQDGTLDT